MRTVYLNMAEARSFLAEVVLPSGLFSNGVRFKIYNRSYDQIVLKNPKLRRRLVHGITIVDEWGTQDKWFSDDRSSRIPFKECL